MHNDTRRLFKEYLGVLAALNGVDDVTTKFSVDPSVAQTLETRIQESSGFLQQINVLGVTEQSGEKVGLGVSGPIAGTTDTTAQDRQTRDVTVLDSLGYLCTQTNFDSHITYKKLDAWRKFKDFQARIRDAILRRQALDRIMIGWNGTSRAATSNIATNPLLQDVNIGWLQKVRTTAPERVLDEGAVAGKVTVGATGDYKTLDGLVFDAVQMLDPWHRNHPNLVVMVSRDLMHEKLLAAVEKGAASNQEENAAQEIVSRARLGGLPVVDAPFFPAGTVLVTVLSNLSIYWQEGARRRHLKDEPEYDRIADYQSSNDAYVVEDFGLIALVEKIERV